MGLALKIVSSEAINHQEAYSEDGACTNWAEEFFSRLRRAEIGHHHHIAGAYLLRYAQELRGGRIIGASRMAIGWAVSRGWRRSQQAEH